MIKFQAESYLSFGSPWRQSLRPDLGCQDLFRDWVSGEESEDGCRIGWRRRRSRLPQLQRRLCSSKCENAPSTWDVISWSRSKQVLWLKPEVDWRAVTGAPEASALGPYRYTLMNNKAKSSEYLCGIVPVAHLKLSVQGCHHHMFQTDFELIIFCYFWIFK